MTAMTDTLLLALDSCDMLLIDGLHASDFWLEEDEADLHIECMDGRTLKHWVFTPAQVEAATFDTTLHCWTLTGDSGEHRLECLGAFGGDNDEGDEHADA
ncbi:hypothetical protein SAMN04487857_1118 [Pseudomonas sp. ok272]|uniref:DUF5629 family protein n=1 Tax=unclassified Pseudomonas TaxID=196821 RepID=UPI0008D6F53C|nr:MULTISPECIES: DUF5629 family protein [unclassified Pseudomonas]SEN16584.1 hypothetical protein SAMN04487857_1118 [Pseudomonas sp. ok272]SFN08744.1 hypothetical protein SAMN04487858_1128 [Pseudomonas sp. ok602]